jgi:hypothetical protein
MLPAHSRRLKLTTRNINVLGTSTTTKHRRHLLMIHKKLSG